MDQMGLFETNGGCPKCGGARKVWDDVRGDYRTCECAVEKRDLLGGEQAKLAAMRRVDEAADEEWKARALREVRRLAESREMFTTDDLWALIEKPREPRAAGPLMTKAVREGWCEWTGRFGRSEIKVGHRRPVRIYRSLLR